MYKNLANGKVSAIPRHPDIQEVTVMKICKQLDIPISKINLFFHQTPIAYRYRTNFLTYRHKAFSLFEVSRVIKSFTFADYLLKYDKQGFFTLFANGG